MSESSEYDAYQTRGQEPCEECGQAPGKYLMGNFPGGILLCKECAEVYDDEIRAQAERDDDLTSDEIASIETAHWDGGWQ